MASERVHLHIADVVLAVPATAGVEAGMVVLTEDDPPFRSLRIIIGQPEARAIQAAWHGAVPGRPSTWDLFVSTVAILGGRLDCVVISAVQEERHYFAVLELEQAADRRIMACRPSDALALAVRGYNVDIFAESSVLHDAGFMPDGAKASEATAPGSVAADPGAALAAREAAVVAREAELSLREQALGERQARGSGRPPAPPAEHPEPDAHPESDAHPEPDAHPESDAHSLSAAARSEIAAEALEVAADAVAVAAEALERPAQPAPDKAEQTSGDTANSADR